MEDSNERSKTGTAVDDWVAAAKLAGVTDLEGLEEDKSIGLEGLKKLGLPRYSQNTLPLRDFLNAPENGLKGINSEKLYINLPPIIKGLQRFRQIDLSQDEAINFIQQNVSDGDVDKYNIIISEFYQNEYSGNIVINPDGRILIEMVHGSHAPLVSGEKTPEYFAFRDPYTNSFKYSFEDEEIRKMLWNTIMSIPHLGEKRDIVFTPGYYEFTLVKKEDDAPLSPIFLDYRENSGYLMPKEE